MRSTKTITVEELLDLYLLDAADHGRQIQVGRVEPWYSAHGGREGARRPGGQAPRGGRPARGLILGQLEGPQDGHLLAQILVWDGMGRTVTAMREKLGLAKRSGPRSTLD
jgi:hypothetical protein